MVTKGAALSVIIIALAAFTAFSPQTQRLREDAMLALTPSAARAYEYGNRHFDARTVEGYDVKRAEELYTIAAAIDSDYPGLQHQLARIEFLYGNYDNGLSRINREIEVHGDANPNALYIKALILGFKGDYLAAAETYERYFTIAPANWGAINDYSWVLMKADLPEGALAALEWGLAEWPENPWLLHNKAIALFELGSYEEAAAAADAATARVATVTEEDWLTAYPGNDPLLAEEGLASFKNAVMENREKIAARLSASSTAN